MTSLGPHLRKAFITKCPRLRRPPALYGRLWRWVGCYPAPPFLRPVRGLWQRSGRSIRPVCGGCVRSVRFKEGLELFLCQRYGVGQQLFKKPHALAEPVCPVLALLLFLLLDQPLFLVFKLAHVNAPGFLPRCS